MPTIPFIKMHGTGNDFIVLDAREKLIELQPAKVAELANRRTGIGFDQCIILRKSTKADVFMQIINADGSEVNACGNATRCVGWLIAQEKEKAAVTIETKAGVLSAQLFNAGEHEGNNESADSSAMSLRINASCESQQTFTEATHKVRVNMGNPKFDWQEIPLSQALDTENIQLDIEGIRNVSGVCVNMGNPHVVFFVDEHAEVDLEKIGPLIEHHSLFPERVNVSVARILSSSSCFSATQKEQDLHLDSARFAHANQQNDKITEAIQLDVWERGAGLTLSCGTAACATLVAAVKRGFVIPAKAGIHAGVASATIQLPGGDLFIEWNQSTNNVWMTGAVAESFRGTIEISS